MRHARTTLAIAIGWALVFAGCSGNGDESKAGSMEEEHAEGAHEERAAGAMELRLEEKAAKACGISTERVSRRTIRKTFRVAARTVSDPEASAHVGTSVAGRIRELRVQIGAPVHAGDVLAVLDSPDLGQAQSEYLTQRDAARIGKIPLDPLRNSYERAKTLLDTSEGHSITRTEVDRREAELRNAEADVARAEANLRAAESRLRILGMSRESIEELAATGDIAPEIELKSPVDGTVVEREATLGQFVTAGGEKLFVVADLTRLWVIADLPEARLADVALKQQVRVEFPAVGIESTGEILLFGAEVSPVTRALPVRIALHAADGRLRPGLLADVEIEEGSQADAGASFLAVPSEAVQVVGGGPVVFAAVTDEPCTFVARRVVLGPGTEGYVAVLGGIDEGDEIVTKGAFYLKADLGKAAAGDQD